MNPLPVLGEDRIAHGQCETPVSILLIEDTDDDASLIMAEARIQGRDVCFRRVETAAELRDALHQAQWDAVLADYQLPQFRGLEALKIVHEHDPDLPFLIVSGAIGEETAVEAMRAGAHDYIMKGHLALLAPALERAMQDAAERRARRQAEVERDDLLIQEQRARSQAEKSVERAAQLQAVTAALSAAVTPEEIAMAVINQGSAVLHACGGGVVILLEDRASLQPLFLSGYPHHVLETYQNIPLDSDLPLATVIRTGEAAWLHTPSAAKARQPKEARAIEGMDSHAAAILPLVLHGEVVGAVEFLFAPDRVLTDDDRDFVVILAQHCIQALDRASLYESLQRSQARFQLQARLLDAVGQAVIATTPDGIINYWNQGADRLFGYSAEEVMGRHVVDVLPTTQAAEESRRILDTLATGRELVSNMLVRRRDGTMVPVLSHRTPLRDETGAVTGIIGVSSDISELKEIEQALRGSEERFRAIFDQATVGVVQSDFQDRFVLVNDYFLTLLGYTRDELWQKDWLEVTHPDDLEVSIDQFQRLAAGEFKSISMQKRYVRKDGTSFWAEISATDMFDSQGNRQHRLTVVADIDARKQAEEALRKSEQHFRQLMDDLHVGIIVWTPDTQVLASNLAVQEMLALTDEQLRGMDAFDPHWNVIQEDGSPFPLDSLPSLQASTTQKPVRNVVLGVFRPTRGDHVWLLVDAEPQVSPDGSVAQVISTYVDISPRREAQQKLAASEQRYRALVETSPDGIVLVDMHGLIIMANAQCARMLGYESPGDLCGVHMEKHLHDAERQQAQMTLEHRAQGTAPNSINSRYTIVRRDGSDFPAEISSFVVPGTPEDAGFVTSTVRDITDRTAYEAQLQHLALHDPLTGLANRTLFYDRLEQTLAAAQRDTEGVAVLVLDLDRFKEINDTFGHQVGDEVICEVGVRLTPALRASDTLSRLGGDEFAILLPNTDLHGAVQTATKLSHVLEDSIDLHGHKLYAGSSIGIALYPDHASDPDVILRYADVAMYTAKQANSDYAVYAIEKDSYNPTRLALNGELRDAIGADQLVLHFQPKMSLSNGEIDGMETLVRWNHPKHGLIPPDDFIPLAEHSGLIRPLTAWVIDKALSQCRAWQDLNLTLGVSVNLSARSLQDPDLPRIILRSLAAHDVDPSLLTLEITESVIMADPDRVMDMLCHLTDVGVKLSIDDFGTGYSSLAYLRNLRAHELKIDKSFVLDLDTNEDSGFIVRSVIDLGHNLGLEVVAEGVESQKSLDILAALTCNRAQGYHLSRPRPAADITHWLQERKALADARKHERPTRVVVIEDELDIVELLETVLTLEGYSVTVLNGPAHINTLSPTQLPDLFLIDIMLPGASGIDTAEQLRDQGFEDVPMIAMSASDRMLKVAAGTNLFSAGIEKPFDLGELVPLVARCIASRTS